MKSAGDVVKEIANVTDVYYWHESVKEYLAGKIREAQVSGMEESLRILNLGYLGICENHPPEDMCKCLDKQEMIRRRIEEIKEGK